MTIQFDLKVGIGYRRHRVTDANFAIGDQKLIGYATDANNVSRLSVDASPWWPIQAMLVEENDVSLD
jgi:hypothetical protein